jgi:DNA-binding MarR family transcriptional regulator
MIDPEHDPVGIQRRFTKPDKHWFSLHNEWVRDTRLDWTAVGILAYLHSHQDGWTVRLQDLATDRASRRHRVEAAVVELETYGYIAREDVRDAGGRRVGTRWLLFDPRPNADHQH